MRNKVLLIEDDRGLAMPLKDFFEDYGLQVFWAENGQKALEMFKMLCPDILLLDIILPDYNGFDILDEVRECNVDVPVILMTGTEYSVPNQVRAYKAGTLNFMAKPIIPQAMLALVQHVLKIPENIRKYDIDGKELVLHGQILVIDKKEYKLRAKDSQLLRFLLDRKGQIVTREVLLKQVWVDDAFENNKHLDSAMHRLKRVLNNAPSIKIKTIYATGYMLG